MSTTARRNDVGAARHMRDAAEVASSACKQVVQNARKSIVVLSQSTVADVISAEAYDVRRAVDARMVHEEEEVDDKKAK
jgi:hypothetical protein